MAVLLANEASAAFLMPARYHPRRRRSTAAARTLRSLCRDVRMCVGVYVSKI